MVFASCGHVDMPKDCRIAGERKEETSSIDILCEQEKKKKERVSRDVNFYSSA